MFSAEAGYNRLLRATLTVNLKTEAHPMSFKKKYYKRTGETQTRSSKFENTGWISKINIEIVTWITNGHKKIQTLI
jgi:hypothetical protein